MRGSVIDHFALSVSDLDEWIAKLGTERVKFFEGPRPYQVGGSRAVMIQRPSREAIELIEVSARKLPTPGIWRGGFAKGEFRCESGFRPARSRL